MSPPSADDAAFPDRLATDSRWLAAFARDLVGPSDAEDLAQDALLAGVRWGPADPRTPRGWIASITRRLAARRHRADDARRRREREVARPEATPPVDAVLERVEIHARVTEALRALDEPLRTVLVLRYWDDLPPRAIAARLGVPVETVRTRCKRGLAALRGRLDRDCGGRAPWLGALVALGGPTLEVAPPRTPWIEVTLMSKKLVVGAVALALVVVVPIALWPRPAPVDVGASSPSPDVVGAGPARVAPAAGMPDPGADAVPDRVPVQVGTAGALEVRVVDTGAQPYADVGVYLRPTGPLGPGVELRTATDGRVRFDDLAAGDHVLRPDRGAASAITIEPGRLAQHTLVIPRGVDVAGTVVTVDRRPVPSATVLVRADEHEDLWQRLAVTDAAGVFEARDVPPGSELHARAAGFQPGGGRRGTVAVRGAPGTAVEVELRLGARGYPLHGEIVLPDGRPAARALVVIAVDEDARERPDGLENVRLRDGDRRLDRDAFLVRADVDGRFATDEVPWGSVAVLARAAPPADPAVGVAIVDVGRAGAEVRLVLGRGGVVRGIARDAAGVPVAGAELGVQWNGDEVVGEIADDVALLAMCRTCRSGADGTFAFDGLFAGEVELRQLGSGRPTRLARFTLAAGGVEQRDVVVTVPWDLELRLHDRLGEALAGLRVAVDGAARLSSLRDSDARLVSDADGRVVVEGVASSTVAVAVFDPQGGTGRAAGRLRTTVERTAGPVALLVPEFATLRGLCVDADGRAIAAHVQLVLGAPETERRTIRTAADGRFELTDVAAGPFALVDPRAAGEPLRRGAAEDGGVVDLGTITIADGARIEVTIEGLDDRGAGVSLVRPGERIALVSSSTGPWFRTGVEPGPWALVVHGTAVSAPVVVEVALVAGETTRRTVAAPRGVAQRFVVDLGPWGAALGELAETARGRVHLTIVDASGRTIVDDRAWYPFEDVARRRTAVSRQLVPGRYTVIAQDHSMIGSYSGRQGRADFEVEDDVGPAVTVVVR